MPQFRAGQYFTRKLATNNDGSLDTGLDLRGQKQSPIIYIGFVPQMFWDGDSGSWRELEGEFAHQVRYLEWFLTENAMQYTVEKLEQLGFNGDLGRGVFTFDGRISQTGFNLLCTHRPDEKNANKVYEDWDTPKEGGGRKRNEVPVDVAMQIGARFNTCKAAMHGPAAGSTPPGPPVPRTPPPAAQEPPQPPHPADRGDTPPPPHNAWGDPF